MNPRRGRDGRVPDVASIRVSGSSLIQELVKELAAVLLSAGLTPRSFDELSHAGFVQAAAEDSKLRNGKVNYSRVAARTGISRADVRRQLEDSSHARALHLTPVQRVIYGWNQDRRFSSSISGPRQLRISGDIKSFDRLAKKYAGDVPHRAVLQELQSRGFVEVRRDKIRLRASARRHEDSGPLLAVAPALIDALRLASAKPLDVHESVFRLVIPAESDLDLSFLRERCRSSAKSMLDGLKDSLARSPGKIRRKRRKTRTTLTLTILLAEHQQSRVATRRRPKDDRIKVTAED